MQLGQQAMQLNQSASRSHTNSASAPNRGGSSGKRSGQRYVIPSKSSGGGGILRNPSQSRSPDRSETESPSRYSKTPGSASHEPSTLKKRRIQSSKKKVRVRESASGSHRPIAEVRGEEDSYGGEEMSYGDEGEMDSSDEDREERGVNMEMR